MSASGSGPGLKNISFVIIDNHPQIIALVRAILHSFGSRELYDANDGAAGLHLIQQYEPDIVITDWAMKPMSGIQMVKTMRHHENQTIRFMPVIMLTGYSERGRIVAARDSGINEYLLKPVSPKSLYSRIRAIIEQPRRYVKAGEYFGPDRRRGEHDFDGPDKRGTGETAPEQDMKQQMTQKEIEDEYFMPTASGSAASADQYVPPGLRKAREMANKNKR